MKNCATCQASYPDEYSHCPRDGSPLTASDAWSAGSVIRGKYRIVGEIGQGGMGLVYRAQHVLFDEVCAVKVMNRQFLVDSHFVKRFKQEAIVARKLNHPNAVRVTDIDESEDGRPFIVMEYVEGKSLKQIIQSTGPMPAVRVAEIGKQVASALAEAHRIGMVHRDIKPANILLVDTPKGEQAKVLDFGIARFREVGSSDESAMTLTGTGVVMGTPQYMSPEQAMGRSSSALDGRSDLYSLGVVMYQMLTGEMPFKAETTMEALFAHIHTPARPILDVRHDLPPAFAQVVMRCLEKKPESRPANGTALIRELNAAMGGSDETATAVLEPLTAPIPPEPAMQDVESAGAATMAFSQPTASAPALPASATLAAVTTAPPGIPASAPVAATRVPPPQAPAHKGRWLAVVFMLFVAAAAGAGYVGWRKYGLNLDTLRHALAPAAFQQAAPAANNTSTPAVTESTAPSAAAPAVAGPLPQPTTTETFSAPPSHRAAAPTPAGTMAKATPGKPESAKPALTKEAAQPAAAQTIPQNSKTQTAQQPQATPPQDVTSNTPPAAPPAAAQPEAPPPEAPLKPYRYVPTRAGSGTLVVTTDPGVEVAIDGMLAGKAGNDGKVMVREVGAGDHKLQFLGPGFPTDAYSFHMDAGATRFTEFKIKSAASAQPAASATATSPGAAASTQTALGAGSLEGVYKFAVVHQHRVGSCTGVLTVGNGSIEFHAANGKHSFVSKLTDAQWGKNGHGDFYVRLKDGREFTFTTPNANQILQAIQRVNGQTQAMNDAGK